MGASGDRVLAHKVRVVKDRAEEALGQEMLHQHLFAEPLSTEYAEAKAQSHIEDAEASS